MEVKAKARFIRMSPRKVRLVVDVIRGKSVAEARTQLRFMKKAAAEPVLKLLNSAAANATHNFNLQEKDLIVKAIMADGGPTLSRWRARAMGRAAPIRKRTTHISIVLEDKAQTPAPAKADKKAEAKDEKKPAAKKAPAKKKPAAKKAETKTTKKSDSK